MTTIDKSSEEQRIHRAVKNHVVNTLGVTREMIEDVVQEQVEKQIKQLINESFLDRFIRRWVNDSMQNIRPTSRGVYPVNEFIKETIQLEVIKQLSAQFEVEVKVKKEKN